MDHLLVCYNIIVYRAILIYIVSYYFLFRYGKISDKVEDTMEAWGSHIPCEISYSARNKMIGYKSYGNFEPEGEYHGQYLLPICFERSNTW